MADIVTGGENITAIPAQVIDTPGNFLFQFFRIRIG